MNANTYIKLKNPNKGFSIVELMIAVFIGLILVTGLITVFDTTSNMNRTQNGLARIQENGRFAILKLKQEIDQAGYQYCMSSGGENKDPAAGSSLRGSLQRPWLDYTSSSIFPGVPNTADNYFDTANLIHGHECDASSCSPDFTTSGSDTSYSIPTIGVAQGNRVANTDVLTIRYISGSGLEVQGITSNATSTQHVISLSVRDQLNASNYLVNDNVIIASCNDKPVYVATVVANDGNGNITVSSPAGADLYGSSGDLTRIFLMKNDVRTVTYYVANNIVSRDGKSQNVPTLFSVVNGVSNALIEGVDRFDVLYGIDKGLTPRLLQYYDASGVQNLPVNQCKPEPDGTAISHPNQAGCGWRGVRLVEVHLLLNTVNNSSLITDEEYKYSIDGDTYQKPTGLISNTNGEKLNRREFFTVIALKNSQY